MEDRKQGQMKPVRREVLNEEEQCGTEYCKKHSNISENPGECQQLFAELRQVLLNVFHENKTK